MDKKWSHIDPQKTLRAVLDACADIRAGVIRGKTEQVQERGLPLNRSLLADAQRFGRLGGLAPGLVNYALSLSPVRCLAGKVAGALDCCGMGGSLGFKQDFHESSRKLGKKPDT